MIIFMITCEAIALMNSVELAFEAYLDYRVKMDRHHHDHFYDHVRRNCPP